MRIRTIPGSRRGLRRRSAAGIVSILAAGALVACSNILSVDYPGRIPTQQLGDPTLAPTLVGGVIGDTECAYNNYFSGSSVHSDEYETANSNVPLANWGERTITADESDYVSGTCSATFGMQVTLHTARFQSENVFKQLQGWTDTQVPNRASLMAQTLAYGGFAYTLMGEGFCSVAFDGGPIQPPSAALMIAEKRFSDAITQAQAAGNTDILNMAQAGLARVELDLKKYVEAAAAAQLVPADYVKLADRGTEGPRRWNTMYRLAVTVAAYTVATAYRTMNDPRVPVVDAGRGAFNSEVRLWIQTKYTSLASPIRLASYREAQLVLAVALVQQGQVDAGMAIINARRTGLGLTSLTVTGKADAILQIIEERRRELSFEGGHRLNDLLRYQIPWKVGSNPFTNRSYGTTTCWPHPTIEVSGK